MMNTTINGLRKDVVSKKMYAKKDLIRVVLNKNNEVFIDQIGKADGRGCYLLRDINTIKIAKTKNLINKSLRLKIDNTIYDELEKIINEQI